MSWLPVAIGIDLGIEGYSIGMKTADSAVSAVAVAADVVASPNASV